jgi:aryl-phospho-beta-D-glucosidase BglC (GH1 family)
MQAQCTVEDLRVLRDWGANLAEIPVSNVYAPNPPYAFQPENLAKLDNAVKAAEQAHLYVALTCREGPGRPDFNRGHEIWRDAEAQEAYAAMWRKVGSHYRGRASIVGYDIMCEPHPDEEAKQPLGDWNSLAKRITVAIREVDKDPCGWQKRRGEGKSRHRFGRSIHHALESWTWAECTGGRPQFV